jgi:hypothetical protein
MKTHSDIEIPVFQNLGTNRWYYHFNHKGKVVNDEFTGEQVIYEADTIVMSGNPDKQKIQAALQSPVTDKGESDDVYLTSDAPELDTDIGLILSYTDDVYRSITRQEQEGLKWMRNEVVKAGQIRTHRGSDFECIQGHITQLGWEPDKALALWRAESSGEVEEWVQPTGAHNSYDIGDQVLFNGFVYESLINANTTVPDGDEPYNRYWKKL